MTSSVQSLPRHSGPPAIAKAMPAGTIAAEDVVAFIEHGTAAFHRTNLALFAAGFATFALIYCVQPLMPVFAETYGIGAAESSLSLSLTTGTLAIALLVAGALSEAWGRKPVMVASLFASAILTILSALMPSWHGLLVLRALMGLAVSGLPAVAMAYVSEEMHPRSIGLAMGLFIGGSAMGGLGGRLIAGILTDLASWRLGLGVVGLSGLVCAFLFWRSLPPSAHFTPRPLRPRLLLAAFADHLRDPGLRWLFLEGFLLMGAFVTLYNYTGFRLLAPPYELSQTAVAAIFVVYLIGIGASIWVGHLAGVLGRRRVFWAPIVLMLAGIALTCSDDLWAIIAGVAVLTFGFFGAHSVASSWVGRRALQARAQASSLYLFFYYLGSSVAGSLGGVAWADWGWPGVALMIGALALTALLIALRLVVLPPRQA
ncbi:MFS transporter [Inquilinus sp.]|uniref:MFS transporter n=1 Tax=Inquilinus sp. TaxID=1932117 RepID=UPI0037852E1B